MLNIINRVLSLYSEITAVSIFLFPFVTCYVCYLVYNIYFHPLAEFPGPKLAGASRWYEGYFDNLVSHGGQYMYEIDRMHEEYGPIVRIAPNELHIQDVEFHGTLYALGAKRNKVPYMIDIFGTNLASPSFPSANIRTTAERDSVFGTVQHDLHRIRRMALNPFFSKQAVTRIESVIQSKVRRIVLYVLLVEPAELQAAHLNLTAMSQTANIDHLGFARCANTLDQPDFSPEWDEMMRGVSEIVPLARQFPGVVQIAQMLPIGLVRLLNPLVAKFSEFDQLVRVQVSEIFTRYRASKGEFSAKESELSRERPDQANSIFHEILKAKIPESEKTVDRMTQEAQSIISAASETTSSVLATTIFHILDNPDVHERLKAELKGAIEHPKALAEWRRLQQLPYLVSLLLPQLLSSVSSSSAPVDLPSKTKQSATVKEGLRISVAICGRLPLVAPEPLQYKSWTIPAGTYVGMSPKDALHHPTIYPSPKAFDPSRWLTTDDPKHKAMMEMAFLPFNKGPRVCIGSQLAYANIYHVLAALFRRFDLELVDTIRERDVDIARDQFVSKPHPQSKGVSVRVVGEAE
ncbi:MAG: hypothetical protein Q9179_002771 [Wetmoreana sp. 5 TL-2023]